MANLFGFEIRKFKSFRGMEGSGFNLDLHYQGKLFARIDDDGNGGEYRYDFSVRSRRWEQDPALQRANEAILDTIVAEAVAADPGRFGIDVGVPSKLPAATLARLSRDTFIGILVDAHEAQRRLTRLCKSKTVVQIGDDIGTENYTTYAVPFTADLKPRIAAQIAKKYPGKPVRWMNEEVARG